jgi:hypothetical protein
MDLGVRQIRTAGKGSGSVELTLPGALRHLVGLPCRVILHDGERPDIVLQPDLTQAMAAFVTVWDHLAETLCADCAGLPPPPFPAADFSFAMYPRLSATPCLSWGDGLSIAARAADPAGAGRSIAACATQAADLIGITPALAAAWGAVCGFLACGEIAFPEWQEACDIAAAAMKRHDAWRPGAAWASCPDVLTHNFWVALAPGLAACCALFAGFSAPGSDYTALRTAWRRGRSIELNRG